MIKLVDVHLSFGARPVLGGTGWMLGDADRVGLVGENGSGKSSLLKVMAGRLGLDRGKVELSRGLTIGYLPQEGVALHGRTLEQEVRTALESVLRLEDEYKEIERRLKDKPPEGPEHQEMLERMCELMDQFQMAGGYELDAMIGKVILGLGFEDSDRARPVESFSGGWQMRIALAKLLLAQPQALLLDEPTNHLDLEARNWLEGFLQEYPYSYLIVSHDRYFLDVTVKRVVEIENGELNDYRGNYSYYLEEKEKRVRLLRTAYEKQSAEVHRLKTFISKYRADKKRAGQVQSRAKRLEKMTLLEPPRETAPIHFNFPPAPRGPLAVATLEGVSKSYGSRRALTDVGLSVSRGEKVAVVGPNGAGKSTLLKIMAGRLKPDHGECRLGSGVEIAYFGQEANEELVPEDTVLDSVGREAPLDMQSRLRSLLGAFLFSGDDVDKKVKVLSGGEKSRLVLARLLLRPANLLLMDEPTNHLDLRAKEVLIEAFRKYTGALVFVAHDRYFLEGLPDRVIEVDQGRVTGYIGDYSDYLRARARAQRSATDDGDAGPELLKSADRESVKSLDKQERMQRREEEKERKREAERHKKRLSELEKAIERTERELGEVEEQMTLPEVGSDYTRLMELHERQDGLKKRLEGLYEEWEGLAGQRPLPEP